MAITICIATDYSRTPGGRHVSEGMFSGEDFREKILLPKYLQAQRKNCSLIVDLDGGYGYAPSFLEEAFGGLARIVHDQSMPDRIQIISEEEPKLIHDIHKYILDALGGQIR